MRRRRCNIIVNFQYSNALSRKPKSYDGDVEVGLFREGFILRQHILDSSGDGLRIRLELLGFGVIQPLVPLSHNLEFAVDLRLGELLDGLITDFVPRCSLLLLILLRSKHFFWWSKSRYTCNVRSSLFLRMLPRVPYRTQL